MFKKAIFLLVTVLVLALAACSPVTGQPAAEGAGPAAASSDQSALNSASSAATGDQPVASDGQPVAAAGGQTDTMQGGAGVAGEPGIPCPTSAAGAETNCITNPDGTATNLNIVPAPIEGSTDPGQQGSAPGAIGSEGGDNGGEIDPADPALDLSTWTKYTDPAFGFSLMYPTSRSIVTLDDAGLNQMAPRPNGAVYFYDPGVVKGGLVGIAPPELAVRVYTNPGNIAPAAWLPGSGLMAGEGTTEVYRGQNAEGVRVCLATGIAPNCFIYFLGNGVVYELTPLGQVGEDMALSFQPK